MLSNIIEIGMTDAGQYWHFDLSDVANPNLYSLLHAIEVPIADGRVLGGTLFASAAYAYAATRYFGDFAEA